MKETLKSYSWYLLPTMFFLMILIVWAPDVSAYPEFFDANCLPCHSGATVSCAACHAHGVHSDSNKDDINIIATTDKATYSPGETVIVTISGGYREGWVRGILYNENGVEVAQSSGSFSLLLSAPAPITPGTYTFSASWYGNQFDLAQVGGGPTFFGPNWTPDPTNPNHGEELVATNSFEVTPTVVCTDNDGDGYYAEGGDCGPQDCDDNNPAINPGAVEDCTDGIDNDCDGLVDVLDPDAINCPPPPVCTDNDGDGYNAEGGDCGPQDCDDNNPAINPGAVENCTDGIDNDCDGLVDALDPDAVNCPPPPSVCTDNDGDGFYAEGGDCGPQDCDDNNPAINPGAVEDCTDGIDNDCDGLVDALDPDAINCPPPPPPVCTDNDGDGFFAEGGDCGPQDCDDTNPAVSPGAVEDCLDGIDNDCDGLIDSADPHCSQAESDYDFEDFHCMPNRKAGKEIKIKVKIQNHGSTNPGGLLRVIGVQGGTVIPLTPEGGLMIFDEPGKGKTKMTFSYVPEVSGDIIWQASIDDGDPDIDEASCITTVSDKKGGGKHDDDDDDDDDEDDEDDDEDDEEDDDNDE